MEETDVSPTPRVCKKVSTNFSRRLSSSSSSFFLLLLFISPPPPPPPRVEGGRWKKLGRGFRHPLAPRLRKLAAAAIGVRGDWGRKGIGSWIRDEKKRFENPHGTRSPISSDLLFLSHQHFSRLVCTKLFVRNRRMENRM